MAFLSHLFVDRLFFWGRSGQAGDIMADWFVPIYTVFWVAIFFYLFKKEKRYWLSMGVALLSFDWEWVINRFSLYFLHKSTDFYPMHDFMDFHLANSPWILVVYLVMCILVIIAIKTNKEKA